MAALHFSRSPAHAADVVVRSLNVVDADGHSRITLSVRQNEPELLLTSSQSQPVFRLHIARSRSVDQKQVLRTPKLELNDSDGDATVQLIASLNQRGLLSFSSPDRQEGKIMLGHFGTADDGTDIGLWGLQVTGTLDNFYTARMLGVQTHGDKDAGFLWPLFPAAEHVK